MIKELFGQAAVGSDPAVLENIKRDEINLATWRFSLSPASVSYLSSLRLDLLDGASFSNYWNEISHKDLDVSRGSTPRNAMEMAVEHLAAVLPRGSGRNSLVTDIAVMAEHFFKVTGHRHAESGLFLFKPCDIDCALHTHPMDRYVGNITLAGRDGMIWQPDETLSPDKSRLQMSWGKVTSEIRPFIQEIQPGDFSIFKGGQFPRPLVHGTPSSDMSSGFRLGAVIFCH